eukprot:1161603-Pelagomonas_calceolata.AAC.17
MLGGLIPSGPGYCCRRPLRKMQSMAASEDGGQSRGGDVQGKAASEDKKLSQGGDEQGQTYFHDPCHANLACTCVTRPESMAVSDPKP